MKEKEKSEKKGTGTGPVSPSLPPGVATQTREISAKGQGEHVQFTPYSSKSRYELAIRTIPVTSSDSWRRI